MDPKLGGLKYNYLITSLQSGLGSAGQLFCCSGFKQTGLHTVARLTGVGRSWEAGMAGLFFVLRVVSGPFTLRGPLHEVFPYEDRIARLFTRWLGSQKQELMGFLKAQAQH